MSQFNVRKSGFNNKQNKKWKVLQQINRDPDRKIKENIYKRAEQQIFCVWDSIDKQSSTS